MPEVSRSQLVAYAVLVVVVVLVGSRALRSARAGGDGDGASSSFVAGGGSSGSGSGSGTSGSGSGTSGSGSGTSGSGEDDGGDAGDGAVQVQRPVAQASVVHVVGDVRRPGVYRLPAGARAVDALKRAGGAGRHADLTQVNLAAKVTDGEQVLVPRKLAGGGAVAAGGATAGGAVTSAGAAGGVPAGPPVDLNHASLEQLQTLDGVGPATAQKIVAYRTAHGGFKTVDDLTQVPGIGPKKLAAIKPHVRV